MTKPDKKNKREYERKLRQQASEGQSTPKNTPKNDKGRGARKNSENSKLSRNDSSDKVPSSSSAPPPAAPLSAVKGEAESAEKLIGDANKRFLEAQKDAEAVEERQWKRNITSNWTKYELPSDDSEDESSQNMTGADFNYVLNNAHGADSHFRLKSEKEWADNAEKLGELSQEFFSLDLVALEKSITCIPLFQQIGLSEKELDKETIDRMKAKAANAKLSVLTGIVSDKTEEVKRKMMSILKLDDDSSLVAVTEPLPPLATVDEPEAKQQHIDTLLNNANRMVEHAQSQMAHNAKQLEEEEEQNKRMMEARQKLKENEEKRKLLEEKQKQLEAEQKLLIEMEKRKALEKEQARLEARQAELYKEKAELFGENSESSQSGEASQSGALEQRTSRRRGQNKAESKGAMNDIVCLKGKSESSEEPTLPLRPIVPPREPGESGTFDDVDVRALAQAKIIDEDLEFLETLDVEIETLEKKEISRSVPVVVPKAEPTEGETSSGSGVVPVNITNAKSETQNLEDWLDDFLDD